MYVNYICDCVAQVPCWQLTASPQTPLRTRRHPRWPPISVHSRTSSPGSTSTKWTPQNTLVSKPSSSSNQVSSTLCIPVVLGHILKLLRFFLELFGCPHAHIVSVWKAYSFFQWLPTVFEETCIINCHIFDNF